MPAAYVLGLWIALCAVVVWLAAGSMQGLGPLRKWTAVGLRCLCLLLIVLMIAGVRVTRPSKTVEVIVLKDVSRSTSQVDKFPGASLPTALQTYIEQLATAKPADDRIGVVSFASNAQIDAIPGTTLYTSPPSAKDPGNGTDIAQAIQLGLATFSSDSRRRLVLISDGNENAGDLEAAMDLAAAQKVPIDVIPLEYSNTTGVVLERLNAPLYRKTGEPFGVEVMMRAGVEANRRGRLTLLHEGNIMAQRDVTLQPGLNVERFVVAPMAAAGVHEFKAQFEPFTSGAATPVRPGAVSPAMLAAGSATAFTVLQGGSSVLLVDNVPNDGAQFLVNALAHERIVIPGVNRITPDKLPSEALRLQAYDCIILANVPRGSGGLDAAQDRALASYVHDLGGGLLVVGGEDAFGAGGWQGSELEKVLPLEMEVPARREIPKGALVLAMHSCEMPDGNYWGEQCGIKAIEAIGERDDIGILSYDYRSGGSQWDFPLAQRADGSAAISAVKNMKLGDMPSFQDMLEAALNGRAGHPGLKDSNARQKHIIVISDGDPAGPSEDLMAACRAAKVTLSTVSVYPHDRSDRNLPPTMRKMAESLGGKSYGPIDSNPNQLPQIFIKEATVVRRSLIQEEPKGFAVKQSPTFDEALKGVAAPGALTGYVLTSLRKDGLVDMPLSIGNSNDPLLAIWQAGLGRSACYTSDARNKWGSNWVLSSGFSKFWAQLVRSLARPATSTDMDIRIDPQGDRAKIVVEALDANQAFNSGLALSATAIGPDGRPHAVRLSQTAPGVYEATMDTGSPGNYIVSVSGPGGGRPAVAGLSVNSSAEFRDTKSNMTRLQTIADRTGGKVMTPYEVPVHAARFFDRTLLPDVSSPLPIADSLFPLLLALLLLDIACRRLAWDAQTPGRMLAKVGAFVRSYTATVPQLEQAQSDQAVATLRTVRGRGGSVSQGPALGTVQPPAATTGAGTAKARFEAAEGTTPADIGAWAGGAASGGDKAGAAKPKSDNPGAMEDQSAVSGLAAAKRRAQERMKGDQP